MTTNQVRILLSVLFIAAAVLAGCGEGSTSPDVALQPVTGTVKLNGSPLKNAGVTFTPIGGSGGHTYFGATDADGKFKLTNRQGMEGCEAGKFKVVISKRVMSDGSEMPQGNDAEAAAAAADSKESLPPKYSDLEATELMREVPAGGKEFEIELNAASG